MFWHLLAAIFSHFSCIIFYHGLVGFTIARFSEFVNRNLSYPRSYAFYGKFFGLLDKSLVNFSLESRSSQW